MTPPSGVYLEVKEVKEVREVKAITFANHASPQEAERLTRQQKIKVGVREVVVNTDIYEDMVFRSVPYTHRFRKNLSQVVGSGKPKFLAYMYAHRTDIVRCFI